MKKILFLFICFLIYPLTVSANLQSENTSNVKTYAEYQQNAKNQCDGKENPWGEQNSLVPVPQYPAFEVSAVNSVISSPNVDTISEEERNRLMEALDAQRIGNSQGFKTVQVASELYKNTMNNLFACGVIEWRLKILDKLRAHFDENNSEISQKLDRETKRLESLKSQVHCVGGDTKDTVMMQQLVNSATRQYCHYRHYLSYLQDNLADNFTAVQAIERSIGNWQNQAILNNTHAWQASYNSYVSTLNEEISRIDATLPRAISAYKEMERAYPAHILLTMIYDDYIRLRKNLSTYMNASTQLYMKAFNAQDTNNR